MIIYKHVRQIPLKHQDENIIQTMLHELQMQIDNHRPMIISTNGHCIAVWGYSSQNNYVLRLNMGWGQGHHSDGYNMHSVDMDMRSMWHNGSSNFLNGYFTLNIHSMNSGPLYGCYIEGNAHIFHLSDFIGDSSYGIIVSNYNFIFSK